MRRISRTGAGLIASHEAIYLFTYIDAAGVPTDGVGNTKAAGTSTPRPGGKITLASALATFERNLEKFAARVERNVRVPLEQHQFDPLVSFDFNTGAIDKGSVDDKLNRGDVAGALTTWGQYVRAGGKVLRGLQTRRAEEIALYRTGRYPVRGVLVKDAPNSAGRVVPASSLPWGAPDVKREIDPSINAPLPPLPTPAPVRGSGNVLIDLANYLWSLWK